MGHGLSCVLETSEKSCNASFISAVPGGMPDTVQAYKIYTLTTESSCFKNMLTVQPHLYVSAY